jgi:hypothetical protein
MKPRYVLWDRENVRHVSTHAKKHKAGQALFEQGDNARARYRILFEFPRGVVGFDNDPTEECLEAFRKELRK